MENKVVQRIKAYLHKCNISVIKLADSLKTNRNTLTGKLNGARGLDLDTLCLILEQFPDLSAEWLLRGTEPMTLTEQSAGSDEKLRQICIDQVKEIYDLKRHIAELEPKRENKLA